ncbi:hypothetical protein JQU17_04035 [Ponticoccus sp. SC2-23]|uniref:hypothetical protein n=1 Tax=Alexandriicola marinus TaxID=2081710 RepID=UPI000FD88BD1|nr:hypothetical protein [Alexandriicola marinus]MBM1219355.1 hypothetical protein [Ponticoccus sp. SC6-9]MBM1223573.1 hypothetical protein [Ponticoccus sp. SC6-15]MBM1229168.1 hypothetical protein [Ponticoccus sp. SC6-38]MBM1232539.1 hypothetical protein [Ponticoccus sp. SC6-45]MBM1237511.1 hypothetical protein [Ponticoccus sp. SC6-49]MBM1241550.1 hypothetical protein [Ponticoccus sp. SC2-64]MBM1246063.1 hypothetical protein [Ponticoccus sp. SC6-42]MBM1250541.1 hypothetical protein [Pontico
MIRHGATAALCAALAVGAAQAECLGPADLTRGVVVEYQTGDYTTIRRIGDGTHLIEERYASGDAPWVLRAWHGVYFVEEWQLNAAGGREPGTTLVVEFPIDPARFPPPLPGLGWTGRTVNQFDDGTSREETTILRFSQGAPLELSGCTYSTILAELRYDWGEEGGLDLRYLYLEELGTAILEWSELDGEDTAALVPVALRRASK